MPKSYVSKQKYKELGNELDYLKTTRRKEIAEKLEYAKSLGDLSENAEYHEARDDQAGTEKRILELEDILKHAQMVEKHHSEVVEIGSAIVVKKTGEKDEKNTRSSDRKKRTLVLEKSHTSRRLVRRSWVRKRGTKHLSRVP